MIVQDSFFHMRLRWIYSVLSIPNFFFKQYVMWFSCNMNIVRGLVCRSVRKMCFATLIKLEKIKPNIQHCRNNSKIKYQNRRKNENHITYCLKKKLGIDNTLYIHRSRIWKKESWTIIGMVCSFGISTTCEEFDLCWIPKLHYCAVHCWVCQIPHETSFQNCWYI
jgi:hypothetical protein